MMKLILTLVTIIAFLCNIMVAYVPLRDLDFSRPVPTVLIFERSELPTCNEYNGCAFMIYQMKNRKQIRMQYRECHCKEGSECTFDRDMLTGCENHAVCKGHQFLLSKNNRSAYRYVCTKISVQNHCNETRSGRLDGHLIDEITHIENIISHISLHINYTTDTMKLGKEANHLETEIVPFEDQVAHIENQIFSLEKVMAHLKNFPVLPENEKMRNKIKYIEALIKHIEAII